MTTEKIIDRNSAKCLTCGGEPVSRHRHDFATCECGAVAVDGGHDYLRRVFNGPYEDTSITREVEVPENPCALVTGRVALEHTDVVLSNVHAEYRCEGQACSVHNRSDHPLRAYPQVWASGMFRECPHGDLHPDPDDRYVDETHDCDGCCKPVESPS